MGIGGIGGYNGYVPRYGISDIPSVNMEEVKQQELEQKASKVQGSPSVSDPAREIPQSPRKDVDLEDVSLTFNRQDRFDYIGQNSDINDLDMQKAISDMQKDQVLQQYQYFVGSARNLMESADGVVLAKPQA